MTCKKEATRENGGGEGVWKYRGKECHHLQAEENYRPEDNDRFEDKRRGASDQSCAG